MAELDFKHSYNLMYNDENLFEDPYSNIALDSKFYDMDSISSVKGSPVYLSLNIQSLNSKFEEFQQFIHDLHQKGINLEVIALQETWAIQYPELLIIPGFQQIVYKNRLGMRGGGVGFYVKNGVNFKIVDELSPFEEKIFESLTIQLTYPNNQNVLLTSGYRSNGVMLNLTQNQQNERFFVHFDELLHKISQKQVTSYIFLDSNFDLLSLDQNGPRNYLNSILSAGYIQCICKATRMQNESRTLLDQILVSCRHNAIKSGTIICDLSDHFPTFVQMPSKLQKNTEKTKTYRSFSEENVANFKRMLGGTDWANVLDSDDVNVAYDAFWSTYSDLFQLNFPLKKMRFNKNIHSQKPFMTQGLLKSRETKKHLHLQTLTDRSPTSLEKYKKFKNLYFKTLRAIGIL